MEEQKVIMTRKAFGLFAFICILWAPGSFAAENTLLYADTFENYTNGTPLIDGTNYWYSSSWIETNNVTFVATVQTNVVATGTNAAMIPYDVTLSNRYASASLPNAWLRMQPKIVRYNSSTNVEYDPGAAAMFYVNSNGHFVVCNGVNGWVTVTQTLAGASYEIDEGSFYTIDIYLNYANQTWRLNVNSVQITNNIGFVDTNLTGITGFDLYNSATTSYLDNVSLYKVDMLLSVSPSVLTNTSVSRANASNQSFKVISEGDGPLSYYTVTNSTFTNWSMTIASNAVGGLTNNASNTVWVTYNTASLLPGVYSNSFNVISPDWEGQTQTVQIVMNIYGMSVSPTNVANAALRGYNATSQTFNVSVAGEGAMSFSASTNAGWLSVSPASGYVSAGTTNILTNTYQTASLDPGDYEGDAAILATGAGGGYTGTVRVALRVYSTPVLGASPAHIRQVVDKGANPTGGYFEVWNASAAPIVSMAYQVTAPNDASNIIQGVSPSVGISTGQHGTVGVYFNNLSGFSAGTYTAVVTVAANNTGSGYAGSWSGTSNIEVVLELAVSDAPAQITATKGDYEDRVAVNWRPVVTPAGGSVTYSLLRHTTFDPDYAQAIVSGLTVTNYDDMTVAPGVRYYYWVRSVNLYGQFGTNSTSDSGYRRLSAPSGLFASDGEYTNKVAVSWAEVDGAETYYVYRGAGGPAGVVYHTAGTEYEDNTVSEGVEYTYYVQSTNSICGSVLSSGEAGYVLSRPIVLSASDGQYVNQIVLSWNAVSGATAYEVWRSTKTLTPPYGGGSKIKETISVAYSDTAVTAGTKYYYWLKSKNATALSEFSARDEGYAATAAVDLSLWGLAVQPHRIGLGNYPCLVSFRLANNGGAALAGDNGMVQLTFYASADDVFGDNNDQMIGTVNMQLTLSLGSRRIFSLGGGNVALPEEEGSYYLFMRLNPVWPSTLAPTSLGGWVTQRPGTLAVSTNGSINYQAMNDYDGDGISDLAVHGDGLWDVRSVDGFELGRNCPFGGSGTVVVMGDYDGDRRTDPMVYSESSGLWQGLLSGRGYAHITGCFGGPGYRAVPGDYDGDGKTEVAVYDTINSLWYALRISGGWVMQGLQFGNIGYEAVRGDYDGDGVWDLAVYNEHDGMWYIRTVAGALLLSGGHWGGPGFSPVAGDYDGDGLWDFAVYDEATGRWYIVNMRVKIIAAGILWGAAGYRPVAGDFDGDGLSDLAMYNTSAGQWYIRTVGGSWIAMDVTWGGAGREAVGEVE